MMRMRNEGKMQMYVWRERHAVQKVVSQSARTIINQTGDED